ncbi:hypothetical protein PTTG_07177, partial [Puccinia triticina 1-1 BBBD Race 1]
VPPPPEWDDTWTTLPNWLHLPTPTGNKPNSHQPIEFDSVDPDANADANGVTKTVLADKVSMSSVSRASTPSILGQPPIEDFPFLIDLQVQALLEPHRPFATEQHACFAINSKAYTRLYHTFAQAFVPYCQKIPNKVVNA